MFHKLVSFFLIISPIFSTELLALLGTKSDGTRKLEHNSKLNKRVWYRSKFDNNLRNEAIFGKFIFGGNSKELDNLLQSNYDAFGPNIVQTSPFIADYERKKRSSVPTESRNRSHSKNIIINKKEGDVSGNTEVSKVHIINDLKPASVFNDYPYEIAVLLSNNKHILDKKMKNIVKKLEPKVHGDNKNNNVSKTNNDLYNKTTTAYINKEIKINNTDTKPPAVSPKRSMNYNYATNVIKKTDFTDSNKRSEEKKGCNHDENKVNDGNVFNKANAEWQQPAPVRDPKVYKFLPKEPMRKSKPVTEKGLIKVIAMLTKTFKKIMRQHSEIKDIYAKVNEMNDEFTKNRARMAEKFRDLDSKFLYVEKLSNKMKDFDNKIAVKDDRFKNKDNDIGKNIKDFENQQKQFLEQQKHFYNIQKLMLAQNEKINIKQNLIAKTQSEISHRQNNFAKILKKAKQLYLDSRKPDAAKLSTSIFKLKDGKSYFTSKLTATTTNAPASTSSAVKINLFSIPASRKSNREKYDPDEMILKEKDDHAIDDLVYKHYFNNTFIDTYMKDQILNSFMSNNIENFVRKTKRNDIENTMLLPVKDNESDIHKRERRWINHHHKRHNKKKDHKKELQHMDNKKYRGLPIEVNNTVNVVKKDPVTNKKDPGNNKKDSGNNKDTQIYPYLNMAMTFCKEIQQNTDQQTFRWCVEKTLRKLQFLGAGISPLTTSTASTPPSVIIPTKSKLPIINQMPTSTVLEMLNVAVKKELTTSMSTTTEHNVTNATTTAVPVTNVTSPPTVPVTSSTMNTTSSESTAKPTVTLKIPELSNFPDNDELEKKLKQFDIVPDTEGNVYFEGSVHASELIADSGSGVDDIVPGLDSNSRVEVDPLTFDIQAKRRVIVRKLNERIKKSLG